MAVQKPAGRTYRDVATKIDTHGIKKKTQKKPSFALKVSLQNFKTFDCMFKRCGSKMKF